MNFQVSAPGKVILFGEHAVVYGKTAVAASLDLRTTLQFNELPGQNEVLLSMPKLNLEIKVSLAEIIEFAGTCPEFENHQELYESVEKFVSNLKYTGVQKLGLEALFYLLVAVAQSESLQINAFRLSLDTKLSIGAGLGSSASFAVCISTCFLHWANLQQKKLTLLDDESQLKKISKFAMGCEKIMHGTPSGIDHTVAIYGSVIEFKKPDKMEPIFGVKKMEILLVDTRVPRSTKDLVAKFADLKQKFPGIVDPILEAIDRVAQEALVVIKEMRTVVEDEIHWKNLATLVEINHGLLASCQVSHLSLEKICWEAKAMKLAAKMTGAGGGGFAYILLPPGVPDMDVQELTRVLNDFGFPVSRTNLGGPGVKID